MTAVGIRLGPRLRGEGGQASVELVAVLPLLLLVALVGLQVQLFAAAASSAEHAARNASRAVRAGDDPAAAVAASLSSAHASRVQAVTVAGEAATVRLGVPDVVPGIDVSGFSVTRTARVPRR